MRAKLGLPAMAFAVATSASAEAAPDSMILFAPGPIAQEPLWSVTVLAGLSAGDDRLVDLLRNPWGRDYQDDYFAGLVISRKVARLYRHFTVESEAGIGFRFGQTDAGEGWAALYLRFDAFPWNRWIRTTAGLSTGLNFLTDLPRPETAPGGDSEEHTSRILHYFSPEITFARPEHPSQELVIRYHHRSGVAGTFGGVWGGSNVLSAGFRLRF